MDVWGTLVDCPSKQQFDEWLKKFEMVCSSWSMFIDYAKDTWKQNDTRKGTLGLPR